MEQTAPKEKIKVLAKFKKGEATPPALSIHMQ